MDKKNKAYVAFDKKFRNGLALYFLNSSFCTSKKKVEKWPLLLWPYMDLFRVVFLNLPRDPPPGGTKRTRATLMGITHISSAVLGVKWGPSWKGAVGGRTKNESSPCTFLPTCIDQDLQEFLIEGCSWKGQSLVGLQGRSLFKKGEKVKIKIWLFNLSLLARCSLDLEWYFFSHCPL